MIYYECEYKYEYEYECESDSEYVFHWIMQLLRAGNARNSRKILSNDLWTEMHYDLEPSWGRSRKLPINAVPV